MYVLHAWKCMAFLVRLNFKFNLEMYGISLKRKLLTNNSC